MKWGGVTESKMGLLCETRGKLVPTNGYLIVAGEDVPGIRPPRVRCRAYRGTDKTVWYDQRECEGPIADQIHDAYAFVCKNMRVGLPTPCGISRLNRSDPAGLIRRGRLLA